VIAAADATVSTTSLLGGVSHALLRLTFTDTWFVGGIWNDNSTTGTQFAELAWEEIAEPVTAWTVGFRIHAGETADDNFNHIYFRCDEYTGTQCTCTVAPAFTSKQVQVVIAGMTGNCSVINGTYALTRDLGRGIGETINGKAFCRWSYNVSGTIVQFYTTDNVTDNATVYVKYTGGGGTWDWDYWQDSAPTIDCDKISILITGSIKLVGDVCGDNPTATATISTI
jgi:hypothetical protein